MGDIYGLRRANGDWFAHEVNGRFHLPLFHTAHDAFMSRLRHFGMLLFQPVTFNARMLEQIDSKGEGDNVDFCIIDDPFVSLKRGQLLARAQLASLISDNQGV
jgi:hypothetical protein